MKALSHRSVLLREVLSFLPEQKPAKILDVTAGGGGHFFEMLKRAGPGSEGTCWDQDPLAESRIRQRAVDEKAEQAFRFLQKNFRAAPEGGQQFDFILADLGVSSFQLDDPERGLSLRSPSPVDFRMNPDEGPDFATWLRQKNVEELAELLANYGEEGRARKVAAALKSWGPSEWSSGERFADAIARALGYSTPSRIHPATRVFQALRIAINDEMGALKSFLEWAPRHLELGGRLAIISFHSLEDRFVKKAFSKLEESGAFAVLTPKPIAPSEAEETENPRSRSAKLRVLERRLS